MVDREVDAGGRKIEPMVDETWALEEEVAATEVERIFKLESVVVRVKKRMSGEDPG